MATPDGRWQQCPFQVLPIWDFGQQQKQPDWLVIGGGVIRCGLLLRDLLVLDLVVAGL